MPALRVYTEQEAAPCGLDFDSTAGGIMLISNYEDAAFRNKRLEKCLRIWMTIMGVTREQADRLIFSLHDHKGALHVLWNDDPTARQKLAFVDAWNECCEYVIYHSTDLSRQPYAGG